MKNITLILLIFTANERSNESTPQRKDTLTSVPTACLQSLIIMSFTVGLCTGTKERQP